MMAFVLMILFLFQSSNLQAKERVGSKVLDFQESTRDEKALPEGCGNPYAETIKFRDFYDNTLAFMAARRGAHSKGVVDLFAVSAIRDEIAVLFPNYTEESPVDRLIMAQLCQYQKIAAQGLNLKDKPLMIKASDSSLADHLVIVSAKMYTDAKALLLEAVAVQRKKEKDDSGLRARYTEVLNAREESRSRVQNLLE
jgi:hypothetical protein